MARAFPRAVRPVPLHPTAKMSAIRCKRDEFAFLVPVRGNDVAVDGDDFATVAADRSQRALAHASESLANEIVGIVDVLGQVLPWAAADPDRRLNNP